MADGDDQLPLYTELAPWFHLLTAPEDYELDARHALDVLTEAIGEPPRTILELGSGGGNSASHMKAHATLTLTDLSEQMLELSRTINPEVEHVQGDMRTLRLDGRTFDAVFVHDAISYQLTEHDLRATFETAFVHLRPGGAAIFEPDITREAYADATHQGGHDGADGRRSALRAVAHRSRPERHLVRRRVRDPAARGRRHEPHRPRRAPARHVPARDVVRAARRRRVRRRSRGGRAPTPTRRRGSAPRASSAGAPPDRTANAGQGIGSPV